MTQANFVRTKQATNNNNNNTMPSKRKEKVLQFSIIFIIDCVIELTIKNFQQVQTSFSSSFIRLLFYKNTIESFLLHWLNCVQSNIWSNGIQLNKSDKFSVLLTYVQCTETMNFIELPCVLKFSLNRSDSSKIQFHVSMKDRKKTN